TATHLTRAGFNPPLLICALQICSHSTLITTSSEVPADKSIQPRPHVDIMGATRFFPKERHDKFLRLNFEYNPHPSRVSAGS
ncbi:hypothetical protein, partial [Comamonas thiooxydans]